MSGQEVSKTQTVVSTSRLKDDEDMTKSDGKSDLVRSILNSSKNYFNGPPKPRQINVILAHIAHETGHGKYVYNYNVGNIKKTKNDPYDYTKLLTSEYLNDKQAYKEVARFRAYTNLDEGVKDYLNLIHRNSAAWDAIENGDPAAFAHALKQSGYYTAPEEDYRRPIVRIYDKKPDGKDTDRTKRPQNKIYDMLAKIYDMLFSMERSITAYDNLKNKSILKKGRYGN